MVLVFIFVWILFSVFVKFLNKIKQLNMLFFLVLCDFGVPVALCH